MRIKSCAWIVAVAVTLSALTFAYAGPQPAGNADDAITAKLKAILASKDRPQQERDRDRYRHPLETLEFFGIKPDMTVVEVWPGKGWYTRILAPFLQPKGKLYGANPTGKPAQEFKRMLVAKISIYNRVVTTEHGPPETTRLAPAGSADMVLTFRNAHNWMKGGYADMMFKAMFLVLKPGGILGIVEHRSNPAVAQDPKAASGYVREDYVIKLAEAAGFKLVAKSEINANPKDTKDYPEGVWTLPPTLKLKDRDKQKYLAIGESDRMTLKFIKPLTAAAAPSPSAGAAEPGGAKPPAPAQKKAP
ncbi:MAG: methyltransferase [Candidatus Binataceae bacterium]|jgi:predicted methyltransferase